MLDDARTVEQARRGDERAWRLLYERHVDLVFRLAVREIGDREAALDVVQETFLRAARGLDGFRGEASFRTWIARIAIHRTRSWLREQRRHRELPLEAVPPRPGAGRGAAEAVARAELAERALAFVRTLPERQRDTIVLRTSEGLSYREIAEILGTSEGSCRVSYHHGMAKLRERFAEPPDSRLAPGGSGSTAEGGGRTGE